MKKIAVVLCGSGYLDGSEIRESVATLWSLSQEHVKVQCFAPQDLQYHVVNCLTQAPEKNESRNMLVESARIARGQVLPLSSFQEKDYDAIIFPGGFGVAKNLCDFAFKGAQGTVRPDVAEVIQQMHRNQKPIGAICIAPALVGLALKGKSLKLTLGAEGEASQEIEKLGHTHVSCFTNDCITDEKNKLVTTPAYMYDDGVVHEIFRGIQKLTREVIRLI